MGWTYKGPRLPPDSFGRYVVKSARFDRLLASTALALVLALSSHAGLAQQSDSRIVAAVPVPDTTLPPPPTAKDLAANDRPRLRRPLPSCPRRPSKTQPLPPPNRPKQRPTSRAATADGGVGDKLRELITSKQFDRLVSRKADRAGIEAYYSAHNYAPLWVSNNAANDRAKSAIAYLAQADAVGLDPSDYPAPDFKSASNADALAEAELKLTASALTFARQAQIGRIHYTRVSADIQFDLNAPDPADVLAKLADGSEPPRARWLQSAAGGIQGAQAKARRAASGKTADGRKGRGQAGARACMSPKARSCVPA